MKVSKNIIIMVIITLVMVVLVIVVAAVVVIVVGIIISMYTYEGIIDFLRVTYNCPTIHLLKRCVLITLETVY